MHKGDSMERLTERHCGVAVIKDKNKLKEAMEKLAAYEEAEEQHIEPGNTIYIVLTQEKKVISKKVLKIDLGKKHDRIIFTDYSVYTIWGKNWKEYINKTVFKREEEAKQALARMENG